MAAISSGVRNLAIGERHASSPFWTNAHTSPLAPCCLASSVSASSSERGSSRGPALIPGPRRRRRARRANTLNSVAASGSPRSCSSSPKRVSGRSIPKRETASANVIRGQGGGGTANRSLSNTAPITASMQLDHVLLGDERHLEVQLGELGLAVGARVLVAEATRDLVVPLEPADHQQLLEQLRRLGQRVERARLDPRRHEVVARALGRRARQVGRLDLQEVPLRSGPRASS